MKFCDLTQFYSPASGGVKRYISEKVRYLRARRPDDEHVLIVPGERDEKISEERSRTYFIESPLISRTSRYRMLLRLEAVEHVLELEQPDLIESGDPYQVAWKAVHSGAALGIPVVGFYHSHFPEAYIRTVQRFFGATVTEFFVDLSRRYVRSLYNRFERTIVPSPALGAVLSAWGVCNVAHINLGVDTRVFQPKRQPGEDVRAEFSIPHERTLLLYVGRLASEKNTQTLFAAFRLLPRERFHLLVVGDGLQRAELEVLKSEIRNQSRAERDSLPQAARRGSAAAESKSEITWLPYCTDASRLASIYRAADLFVHPGVQETFGLVTLEAQACGTPVIGIRGSYMDRIVHGDQMLWARANTPAALAGAILETAAGDFPHDPDELHACIAAAYSWEQVFARLFDLYREVVHNYRRP